MKSYSRYQDPFDIKRGWDRAPTITGRGERHFICGEAQVGKTTLRYHGMRELAELGAYDKMHLKMLPRVARTTLPNRFEISRNQTGLWGFSPKIDRWCDIDGGVLAELLDHLRRPKEKNPDVFAKLLGKTDSIALVIPARVIVEAWKQEQAQQDLGEFLPGIRQFIQNHLPRKNWIGWDKCQKTLVISQSARIVANEKQRSTLRDGLEWFTGYTGLNNLMKCTFIVDSIPEEAKQFEVVPARLAENGRGKRFRVDNSGAAVCSAGVVLAWMLKRLDPAALDSAFVVKV
jgi:hypothetical protein